MLVTEVEMINANNTNHKRNSIYFMLRLRLCGNVFRANGKSYLLLNIQNPWFLVRVNVAS